MRVVGPWADWPPSKRASRAAVRPPLRSPAAAQGKRWASLEIWRRSF